MERIAKFEKVSKARFAEDLRALYVNVSDSDTALSYGKISLPRRATGGSAGYDLITPIDISLGPGEEIRIPTGIRVRMREDYCLFIMPRSGLGSRYRFQLDNTLGVIDSDYYHSANEGHIFVPMINDSRSGKRLELKAGAAFAQCVFCPFGITLDDDATEERDGGFGSTDGTDGSGKDFSMDYKLTK